MSLKAGQVGWDQCSESRLRISQVPNDSMISLKIQAEGALEPWPKKCTDPYCKSAEESLWKGRSCVYSSIETQSSPYTPTIASVLSK